MRFSTFSGATAQLLPLMDADKNGKVSKEEFMRFMQAKFDFADKNKGGELDPEELERLQHASSHPANGPGRSIIGEWMFERLHYRFGARVGQNDRPHLTDSR